MKPEDISDGRIQDTTGEIIYKVKFQALVFRPIQGEILDGIVKYVTNECFMIESGPLLLLTFLGRTLSLDIRVLDLNSNVFKSGAAWVPRV